MYQIGQYRSTGVINDYYQPINITLDWLETDSAALEDDRVFVNACGNLARAINNTESFYLRFGVRQQYEAEQNFYLKLRNSNLQTGTVDSEQLIEEYKVGQGGDMVYFDIIITPNSEYNQIVWELKRTIIDYQTSIENVSGRLMQIQIEEDNSFFKLKDIFKSIFGNSSNIKGFSKIGVQGPPLLLMCINGQQIRVGYNGIYEINNGMKITSISFVPAADDYFIMDYEYQEEEEES